LLHDLTFVQIDEVISGPKAGMFRQFFLQELAPFAAQVEWIGDRAPVADVAILGVGVNGHVAFHEPGLSPSLWSACVPLSSETLGYLRMSEPTWGLTYGVAAFLKCREILVLARGENKRLVLERSLRGEDLPITQVLAHPNATLLTDFPLNGLRAA
jgi:6-phosphogluconolactonase/glucosamine-6-phosphate isomerase/deaminase